MAGKILKIPIDIYELNVIPGRATKFLSPIATNTFVVFEKTKKFNLGFILNKNKEAL